ncbi:MAG: undecaprenyl diphosphate synthase [Lysobacterales bacterium]
MSEFNLDMDKIPQHVAIILDGNGRWAQNQDLARAKGHVEGVKRVEEIMDESSRLGIKALTLYTFSTENWKRPQNEVALIMNILDAVLVRKLKKLKADNIRFQIIGKLDHVPEPVLSTMKSVIEETKDNDGLSMNLAFNYGSRSEIVDAIKLISQKVVDNDVIIDDIDEDLVSSSLYTKDLPDPDLLIRTSGEQRISNFLLWQLSYAEFYFTDKLWPDFTIKEYHKAIINFQNRDRRFGGVEKKQKVS